MKIYSWKSGHHAKVDAVTFAAEYQRLHAQHTDVTAEVLVHAAQSKNSPLHMGFEWDNRIAGHAYRLTQARHMMAAIEIREETVEAVGGPTRLLVAVKPADQSGATSMKVYIPLTEAMADPQRREEVLRQALRELHTFQAKYRQLAELAAVFEAIEHTTAIPVTM